MTVPEHPTPSERPFPWTSPSGRPVADGAGPESVPRVWDEFRDPAFFTITARLFRPAATLAMTVLLASHDVDVASVWARPASGPTEPSAAATNPLGDTARSDYSS